VRLSVAQFRAAKLLFLYGEGDSCTGVNVLLLGNVRIFKSSAGGREQVLSIDGPGDSIAELPVFDGGTYPALSAQAVGDSALLYFSRQDFPTLCLQARRRAFAPATPDADLAGQ
jgi:CRP-like cAMP-binding protein